MVGRRPIVLVWSAVGLLCAVLLIGTARPLAVAWRCWLEWRGGEHAPAELVEKLEAPTLVLRIEGGSRAGQACTADTSAAHHAALAAGDRLDVVYRADRPGDCELEATLTNSAAVVLALTGVVAALIAAFLAAGFQLQRSLGRPAAPSTRLPGDAAQLACPACGSRMEEGSIVPTGGIHWRSRGQAIGLPSVLGGLPGSVGWRSRACLHALRCASCELVTFRYGKPADAARRAPLAGSSPTEQTRA